MDETFTPPVNTRFTDYPFRKANLTPSQLDWRAKRDRAIKLYRESGDSSLAEEIGLFWNKADEERASEAQRLRLMDNPFSPSELSDSEMPARYQPVLARRRKDTIKKIVGLFQLIVEPYPVFRAMNGPLVNGEGRKVQVGDEIWIDGFMSASRHPGFAAECAVHAFGEGFVMMEIQPAPDAETITLGNEMKGRREYESIFNVGQKVRIEKAITDFRADFHPMDKVAKYYVGTLIAG